MRGNETFIPNEVSKVGWKNYWGFIPVNLYQWGYFQFYSKSQSAHFWDI